MKIDSTQPPTADAWQWDIDRYLLDDPSFDRDTFEQRMASDEWLARQVANSVLRLQLISTAAALAEVNLNRPAIRTLLASRRSFQWAALATVAVLLLGASLWQFQIPLTSVASNTPAAASELQLARIADNWVAFEDLSVSESAEVVSENEFLGSDEPGDESDRVTLALAQEALAQAARVQAAGALGTGALGAGASVADAVELEAASETKNSEKENSEPADWLVEAAREFYLANNEGVAG